MVRFLTSKSKKMEAFFPTAPQSVSITQAPEQEPPPVPRVRTAALNAGTYHAWHDGEAFPGGYGPTPILTVDYWTLRARSAELFERNIYFRGLIRRFVTTVIGTGLTVEATPDPLLVGMSDEDIDLWTEQVESLFELWGSLPELCCASGRATFPQQQRMVKTEALVTGDVLEVMTQDPRTKLPRIRKISGGNVRTPPGLKPKPGVKVVHGVELGANGEHVAFYVHTPGKSGILGSYERIPAKDSTGRHVAWLVYGITDRRLDEVRGQPILAIAMQALKDVNRYKDSALRKALITSMVAFVVTKKDEVVGSKPTMQLGGGFSQAKISDQPNESGATEERVFNVAKMMPGSMVDELAPNEEMKPMPSTGTDEKFSEFEGAIVSAVAWMMGMPPEVAGMRFSNNFSASMAANNEGKVSSDVEREEMGDQMIKPCYRELLLSLVLLGQVRAPGLLDALNDPAQWFVYASWMSAEMSGAVKPSVDPLKLAKALDLMVISGFITRARATRLATGMKHSRVVKQLEKENARLALANAPLVPVLKARSAPYPEQEEDEDDEEGPEDAPEEQGESKEE